MGLHRVEQNWATNTHTVSVVFCYAAELTSTDCGTEEWGTATAYLLRKREAEPHGFLRESPCNGDFPPFWAETQDSFSIKGPFLSASWKSGLFTPSSCWAPQKGSFKKKKQTACSLPLRATFLQGWVCCSPGWLSRSRPHGPCHPRAPATPALAAGSDCMAMLHPRGSLRL